MFEEYGLKPHKKVIASSTKVLSFIKQESGPKKGNGRKSAATKKTTKKVKKQSESIYDKLAN